MILIGTSGSTKCDWELVKEGKPFKQFSTNGVNPFFHTEEEIASAINQAPELASHQADIKVVYFYGAGCHNKAMKVIVERALNGVFPKSHLYVNHDIVAAAFATYDGSPAITCILGTGSNSCYFDGDMVKQGVPALDYILGDEGGGSYFGRKLLKLYLYKDLPEALQNAFEKEYHVSQTEILENVYMKPYANVYLASFMKFVQAHKNDPYIYHMVKDGFTEFVKYHVLCYPKHQSIPVHFVGAVAFFFKDILAEVCQSYKVQLGKVIKEPIEALVKYHVDRHYK